MAELNIIDLIESNPITRLTDTYNIKLLDKIKANFTEADQQLFISSFYCYLNYDTKKDFVVDLDDVWKWIGFSQKIHASVMIEKNFKENCDFIFDLATARAKQDTQKRGGHNIKKIMMTIACFKSLCLKAQTKKASEIHEYYMRMEEVLHEVIAEEGTEFKKKIEEQKHQLEEQKTLLDQTQKENARIPEQETHKILLRKYGTTATPIIYIIRIKKNEDGTTIVKIGESRKGIKNRLAEFMKKYNKEVLILDCFHVHDSVGLERYLHHHSEICSNKVTTLEGHEKENELFLIDNKLTYQRLIDIIQSSISQYNIHGYEQVKLENEQLRNQLSKKDSSVCDHNPILQEILKLNYTLLQKVDHLERSNQELLSRVNSLQTKTTTLCSQPDPHLGPRLQKNHPETLELIHVYETVTECMKEDEKIKRPSLNKAVRENTVYNGFRWKLVDRTLDATVIHDLQPTKKTLIQKNGYIAKVNQEQTEIVAVYLDRKTATQYNKYPSISSLDMPVKNHTLKDGYYYQLYEECDSLLKNKFESKHGAPILYHDGIGQYDSTGKLTNEYTSRFDCTSRNSISQKSLAKVLDKPLTYRDHYFKSMGSKLFI